MPRFIRQYATLTGQDKIGEGYTGQVDR
jgi:hypothetical protein